MSRLPLWWRAALKREPDASFVFGVTTTGIYCRSTCPARRPLFRNVEYFPTPKDAERQGFRACKRCGRPPDSILAACALLAKHELGLDALARRVGGSPTHLLRAFRAALGVTPKQYTRRLRFERFSKSAGNGVAAAQYAAGFGSSRRLYESARIHLGMTPGAAARKGAGMSIDYDLFDGPLGRTLIAATPLGICLVAIDDSDRALEKELRARFPRAALHRNPALLRFARKRLKTLRQDPLLPLDVRATAFQAKVWESLRAIPRGETRTYAEIAKAVGKPRAVRAVGAACGANPVAILVPCHRVVGTDGKLHGYRWGLERKRKLLAMEKAR